MFCIAGIFPHDHSHVTFFSPVSSPRVPDHPVPLISIIANIDDSMVVGKVGTRKHAIFKDPTLIVSEVVIDIDIDGMRTIISNGLGKSIDTLQEYVNSVIIRHGGSDGRVVILASS